MDSLDAFLSSNLNAGRISSGLFLETLPGRLVPSSTSVPSTGENLLLEAKYDTSFSDELLFKAGSDGIVCERRIKNVSNETQRLVEAGFWLDLPSFGMPEDDYFYHVENPRIYSRMAIAIDARRGGEMVAGTEFDSVAGNKWVDPDEACERIGYSPYQPFPAILLSNYKSKRGLVHGTLSQRVFFHNYLVGHENGKISLDIRSSFKAVEYRELKPGEIIEDRWHLGVTDEADNIEKIFGGYVKVLKKHMPPLYGATDINRHSVVWGSWNDGIFRDIDEARLVEMADFISNELPTVKWMQIDDGYAEYAGKLKIAHGLGAPWEVDGGTDMKKFPENLSGFTRKVRAKGVEPALWIGGHVPADAPLGKANPDWFFDYSARPCVANSKNKLRFFDVSKPAAREYMCKALDFLITESGFRGVKHDFWSYAFEDSRVRLASKEKSGYEWRSWWLDEIRKRLPENGYFQTGCDIVMGNPFLAERFTNYRYGIDIGSGKWENILTNYLWGTACFALHTGDMFVPNSDAIGLLPGLSDTEALFCINYCLISRSMVEVGGWLDKDPSHPRMKWVKKALCCPDNGQDVFFANYDYRDEKSKGPEIWYLKTPHFSLLGGASHLPLRTVALFNLEDGERELQLDIASLALPAGAYVATDVWSLESMPLKNSIAVKLPGRSSRLFSINASEGAQVLDSNMQVSSVCLDPVGALAIEFPHGGELQMVLNRAVDAVHLNGVAMEFETKRAAGNCRISLLLPASVSAAQVNLRFGGIMEQRSF